MFQTKKWNWKRVAANLLLVPVLAGGSVAVVHAQFGKNSAAGIMPGGAASSGGRAPAGPAAGDSKQLLKDGRKALAEGRFAEAQDLAQAAEANNPGAKWGLFDDTPAALRKDIAGAKTKADKVQADALVKQAKALAAKPTQNEAERAYNLDSALQMARKADQLHGPYSAWDMGDRADKLVKELTDSRSKIKVPATRPPVTPGTQVATRPGTNPGGVTQTGFTGGADAKKQGALKLMAEGRALADQGNFASAKSRYLEADKLGAKFAPTEYSPGYALQELNTRGAAAMDKHLRDAQALTAQRDYVKANVCLTSAGTIAGTLGLYAKPVDEAKAALFVASSGAFGTAPASGIAAVPGAPEHLVPVAPGGTVPTVPPGTATVYNGGKPGAPTGIADGKQLLAQAAYEFKAGEFETAERLARQAHNLGMQNEARGLLNSIDTERFARKQRVAAESVKNAKIAYDQKDYQRAVGVLVLIDANLLTKEAQAARSEMLASCRTELAKSGAGDIATVGGTQPIDKVPLPGPGDLTNPPGTARVTDTGNGATTADALRSVQFQKLRSEGLKAQADAQAAFGRGETDLAMQMLVEYGNRVRASGLDTASIGRLLRPVEGRLQTFQMMKGQADAIARQSKEKRDAKEQITNRGVAEEDRKRDVAANMRHYHDLVKKGDFAGAERVALQTKQLNPDDPAVGAMYEMAKLTRRVKEAEQIKSDREKFFLGGMNDNEKIGPLVTSEDPVAIKLDALMRSRNRGSGNDAFQKSRTPAEFEIELKMEKPISIEFTQTPLDQAIGNLRTLTGLPLEIDRRALADENISEVRPVTVSGGTPVATKNILAFTLDQAGLSYVIERDMVIVTTTKKSKGRMVTKVFSVADLVTPVPNFALPDYTNFDKMLQSTPLSSGKLVVQGLNTGGGGTPHLPSNGLGSGQPTGSPSLPGQFASSPGIQQPSYMGGPNGGNRLETSPLAGSSNVTYANNSKHEQLIKLVTSMVRPFTWDGHGGAGKIEYFDIGHALVVNQTADVVTEVQDLLEALRRLQDLAVAVEVRIVSLAESFYERMGLDFSVNIKTNTTKFEPALTSNTFRPAPFINDINNTGVTVGLTPAGTFTPDLDVPIRTTTFNRAIPGFGNYPNAPGNNGGLSLGLAFLNDIQVYTFMEMAQGDQRSNIMQAPKLTLFNGQTATLGVQDSQFFVTSVQVLSVNGQIIFIPQNQPLNGPDTSINITIQAVVSADRRFVRLNLPLNLAAQAGASVPLFPVTTFITPVFEGGSQGQPVPFTQFLQQPAFTSLNIQSSVVCPDGGTVILGGLKTMRESRNEFGPPFLSKIPYLNRLFKNVGVGREGRHVMIMVTPRIIINSEEEIIQTEGGRGLGAPGG